MLNCTLCSKFSIKTFCTICEKTILKPDFITSKINELLVYSFYFYKEIQELIKTKHSYFGYYVFKSLAKISFAKFNKEFKINKNISVIPIDDNTKSGYSHTALLAKELKSFYINYKSLRIKSKAKYSGKSLKFRLENPRKFVIGKIKYKDIILVDDVLTTGSTLKEAHNILSKNNYNVLFGLTLAKV